MSKLQFRCTFTNGALLGLVVEVQESPAIASGEAEIWGQMSLVALIMCRYYRLRIQDSRSKRLHLTTSATILENMT